MRSFFISLLAAAFAFAAHAQETPRDIVDALFDGMRSGDGEAVRDVVADQAPLMRVEADGSVRPSTFDGWADWVDVQNAGDADEQIFDVSVNEHGNLASVWAPFILHYKGELAGCGVNQFTLARAKDSWVIIHGIDTQDGGDCSTFKARYGERASTKAE